MERITNTELADKHLKYGMAKRNAQAAEILYREKYPKRDASERQFSNSDTICVNMDNYEVIGIYILPKLLLGVPDTAHQGRIIHERWCISAFFDCGVLVPTCYVPREMDWVWKTSCIASTIPGLQSNEFLF
ncbi:hypothetical protein TNCV_1093731 [Trichonephila clavipes]|uniref:Uncharacterized protein n=1 Tax=Trichonephila clavipes TaxID=2585209 RepID=A0A8X6UZC1_TRICX|nr:hypothetical protein TNCV_1093731 [Trichonephila clavipes]